MITKIFRGDIYYVDYSEVDTDKCDCCNYHGAFDFLLTKTQTNLNPVKQERRGQNE